MQFAPSESIRRIPSAAIRRIKSTTIAVCPFRRPRLRQRWLLDERNDRAERHMCDTEFKVAGSKGIPKMAVLYDLVISRISTELCSLFIRNWPTAFAADAKEYELWLQFGLVGVVFLPVFSNWCQVSSYINHFDPVEDNIATSRGGEITYLVSIILLLGATFNMTLCADATTAIDESTRGCGVSASFMALHRFYLCALGLGTWFLLRDADKRQARYFLIGLAVHNAITGCMFIIQTAIVSQHGYSAGRPVLICLAFMDMFFPFVAVFFPSATYLPADLSMWVARCETIFKAGLTTILLAAVSAGFQNRSGQSTARHMSGYVTPLYAFAFKVLYFDYTANVSSVYVDPGNWRFLMWILLHIPLMLAMIILGISLSQELRDFDKARLAPMLLPRAAFLALLSTALLESLMVRGTHMKSLVSRTGRIVVRVACGVPLLFLPCNLSAYKLLWIPGLLLAFIAIMDRIMRIKREPQPLPIEASAESFISVASEQVVELGGHHNGGEQ